MERLTHNSSVEVCIAHSQKVKTLANEEEYEAVLISLLNLRPRPQVVVCFCEGVSINKLFKAQKMLRKRKIETQHTFQWIGSDAWADR